MFGVEARLQADVFQDNDGQSLDNANDADTHTYAWMWSVWIGVLC
jgi:hypothetical protein